MNEVTKKRQSDARDMVQNFAASRAKVAKVTSARTDNPYSVFVTTRRNIRELGLEGKVAATVVKGVCYIRKVEEEV